MNTRKPDFFEKNVRELMQRKREMKAEKSQKFVEMTPEFMDLLRRSINVPSSNHY